MDYQEKLAFLRSYRWSLARERDLLEQIEEIKARAARQSDIARAAHPPKKGYTNEKLGAEFVLPEHAKKFVQPPMAPQGTGKNAPTALQLDCYELDKLNWRRRQEGKPALNYGKWVALGRPKA